MLLGEVRRINREKILNTIEELVENLPDEQERKEFIRLFLTLPHEISYEDKLKYQDLCARVNLDSIHRQWERETVKIPHTTDFNIINRNPYFLCSVLYSDSCENEKVLLPSSLVPQELKNPPNDSKLSPNRCYAEVSVDLDRKEFLSFKFLGYCEKLPFGLEDEKPADNCLI